MYSVTFYTSIKHYSDPYCRWRYIKNCKEVDISQCQVCKNLLETDPPMTDAEVGVRGDVVVPEVEGVAVAPVVDDL